MSTAIALTETYDLAVDGRIEVTPNKQLVYFFSSFSGYLDILLASLGALDNRYTAG